MKDYNVLPKHNIEYILRIPETGNILHCVYEGMLENGRLSFINLQYNTNLDMSRKRFSFLYAKCKKGEKPYIKTIEQEDNKKTASAPTCNKKDADVPKVDVPGERKTMSFSEATDDIIKDLINLSEDEKARFNEYSEKSIDEYIKLLERCKNSFSSVFDINSDCLGIFAEIDKILSMCNIHIA